MCNFNTVPGLRSLGNFCGLQLYFAIWESQAKNRGGRLAAQLYKKTLTVSQQYATTAQKQEKKLLFFF